MDRRAARGAAPDPRRRIFHPRVLRLDVRPEDQRRTRPCRSTVEDRGFGELVVRIIESAAESPAWRDRVRLAWGFAEDVARRLLEGTIRVDDHRRPW